MQDPYACEMNVFRPSVLTSRSRTSWWFGVRIQGSEASFGKVTKEDIQYKEYC